MPNEIHITTENKCKISPFPVFYYDNGCVSLEQYHTCKDRHNWHCEFLFKLVFWCARTWESSLFVNFIQTEWRCNNTLGTDRFALISARHPGALTAPRLLLELIKVKFLLHYSVVYLSNKNWKWRSYLKKKKITKNSESTIWSKPLGIDAWRIKGPKFDHYIYLLFDISVTQGQSWLLSRCFQL